MTTIEFSYEFDLLYNNIRSNKAPGVDEYEKSLFLTQAQEFLVKSYYESFENSEKAREILTPLVISDTLVLKSIPTGISSDLINAEEEPDINKYYTILPKNCWFILNEYAKIDSNQKPPDYLKDYKIMVKPILLDDYYKLRNNPFKGPNNRQVLRYNITYNVNNDTNNIILASKYKLTEQYFIRYLKKPDPIVLFDNTTSTEYATLTVDGAGFPQSSILPESVHREIVEMAVNLAIKTFADRLSGNNQQQQ